MSNLNNFFKFIMRASVVIKNFVKDYWKFNVIKLLMCILAYILFKYLAHIINNITHTTTLNDNLGLAAININHGVDAKIVTGIQLVHNSYIFSDFIKSLLKDKDLNNDKDK